MLDQAVKSTLNSPHCRATLFHSIHFVVYSVRCAGAKVQETLRVRTWGQWAGTILPRGRSGKKWLKSLEAPSGLPVKRTKLSREIWAVHSNDAPKVSSVLPSGDAVPAKQDPDFIAQATSAVARLRPISFTIYNLQANVIMDPHPPPSMTGPPIGKVRML